MHLPGGRAGADRRSHTRLQIPTSHPAHCSRSNSTPPRADSAPCTAHGYAATRHLIPNFAKRSPTKCGIRQLTSQRTPAPQLSRPVEDCKGCRALAGVRNVGLDDPRAGRPDSHCNFGDRRIRGVSCGCSTQRKSLKRGVPSKRFGTHAVTRAHCSPPPTGPVSAAAQAPPIDRLTIKSRSRRRQVFPACAHRLPQQPWWLPPSLKDDGWAGRRTTS